MTTQDMEVTPVEQSTSETPSHVDAHKIQRAKYTACLLVKLIHVYFR